MACTHEVIDASVNVHRLEDSGQFQAELEIKCAECGEPFLFLGLPIGLDLEGVTVSPDCQQARLAILPASQSKLPSLGVRGFNVKRDV